MNFAVDKVIYFGYYETIQEQRKKTVDFLNEYCNVQETEFYSLSRDNLQSILNTMRIKIKNELENNNQIYFDITGGESLILVAFGMLSKEFETPMHQYDIPYNRLIELDEGAAHSISRDVEPRSVELNIDRIIKMHGGIINYNVQNDIKREENDDFMEDVDKIWHVATKAGSLWNPFSDFLRANMEPDDNLCVKRNVSIILNALERSQSQMKKAADLNRIIDQLADAGLFLDVKHCEGIYSFRFKNIEIKRCLWEGGSILELHTYKKEKQQSDDCKAGVHIDWDGIIHSKPGIDVMNEIDVLSLKGNILTFISCKSGNISGSQILHALYELKAVADRFGGKYAKKILVTMNTVSDVYMERAQEMNIQIVTE
jgi:hypothetical protein